MRPNDAGSVAERVYPEFEPLAYDEAALNVDFALLKFLGGMGRAIQQVEDLARDPERPIWAKAVDVTTCPGFALPWLGQFVGVSPPQIQPGESEAAYEARLRGHIQDVAGWRRGTPGAIRAAIQEYLTGTKAVMITERDTSAYHFDITTRDSETPVADAVIIQVIKDRKPAGLQFTYASIPDWTYNDLDAAYATYNAIDAAYATYDDIDANTP